MGLWHFAKSSADCLDLISPDISIGFGRTLQHDFHRNLSGCHPLYANLQPWWRRWRFHNHLEGYLEQQLHTGTRTRLFVPGSNRVSAQLQQQYAQSPDRFVTIHAPADTALFRPSSARAALRDALCQRLETNPARPILLVVSLSRQHERLDTLLQAFVHIDASLWIAGAALGRRDRQLLTGLGLSDRVRAVPVTTNLVQLFQAADWFLHPTLYDVGAAAVLRAMACGLPGLISTRDGHSDHICDGENGFVVSHPDDAAKLAGSLQRALALTEVQRMQMGAAARAAMERLTWTRHIDDWNRLFAAYSR